MGTAVVSADEFQALEQKVLQTVELIKKEREARAHAEAELAALREQMSAHQENASSATKELESMQREREQVRQRVEAMLAQMDELL